MAGYSVDTDQQAGPVVPIILVIIPFLAAVRLVDGTSTLTAQGVVAWTKLGEPG
jgi:hypothetical protein